MFSGEKEQGAMRTCCAGGDSVISNLCACVLNHVQHFWDPMDCRTPGSSVHGILQARILEWVAISYSRGSSGPAMAGRLFTPCHLGSHLMRRTEMLEIQDQSLGQEDPLEEGMATHSSILAWRIPRTEEPGGLQPIVSQRIRHE